MQFSIRLFTKHTSPYNKIPYQGFRAISNIVWFTLVVRIGDFLLT